MYGRTLHPELEKLADKRSALEDYLAEDRFMCTVATHRHAKCCVDMGADAGAAWQIIEFKRTRKRAAFFREIVDCEDSRRYH